MGSDLVSILLIGILEEACRQNNWAKQIKWKGLVETFMWGAV